MKQALLILLNVSLSAIAVLSTQTLTAQTLPKQNLQQEATENNTTAIAADTISQQGLTIPSLWWAKEQFGGEVLNSWSTYPAEGTTAGRVDLIVNRQNWSLLDYLERYEFIYHFGNVAQDFGYNLRVLNEQNQLLATYTCSFNLSSNQCDIELDATGRARIRGSDQ